MRRLTALLFALIPICYAVAQKDAPAYGEITPAEMQMTSTPLDSEADAVVLLRTGETFWVLGDGNDHLQTNVRVRIKILKDKGVDRANVAVRYESKDDMESVDHVEGQTINVNEYGSKETLELNSRSVFRKAMNNRVSELRFTMPGVKKGSIIEYQYSFNSKYYESVEPWEFQEDLPTLYSRYSIAVPPYFDFNYTFYKTLPVSIKDDQYGNEVKRSFIMQDIPSLKEEPYMTARRDFLQHLDFQIAAVREPNGAQTNYLTTWPKISYEMKTHDLLGGQLKKTIPHTEELDARLAPIQDPVARMETVLNYVRTRMTWDGNHSIMSESVKDAWENKNGMMADINLILVNLLRKAGLDAYPMLISTRAHGAVNRNYPMLTQFNGVMAYVHLNDFVYVLDATDGFTPSRLVPPSVLHSLGFVINGDKPIWVDLNGGDSRSATMVDFSGEMDGSGVMKAHASIQSSDYSKVTRCQYLADGKDRFRDRYFTKAYTNLKVDSLQVTGEDNDSVPLEQNVDVSMNLNHSGNYWFFSPNLFTGLETNPFTADQRFTNVDFGHTQVYNVVGTFTLPDGYKFETLPVNMRLKMYDSSIVMERMMQVDQNTLSYRITVQFKQPVYLVSEYPIFKEFYKKLFAALSEQVVIRKKA